MKKTIIYTLLIILNINLFAIKNWEVISTSNFDIYYPDGYLKKAEETLFYLEKYYNQIDKLTGNKREEKTSVVIEDVGNSANGFADIFNMRINIYSKTPSQYSTFSQFENWLRFVSIHEYTHISHLGNYETNTNKAQILNKLFGNNIAPNLTVPYWIIEGITVYNESETNSFEGRLNGGDYEAIVKAQAKKGELSNFLAASYPHDNFPSNKYYIYGGKFIKYLSEKYGKEKLDLLFTKNGKKFLGGLVGNIFPYFGIDKSSKEVYGKSLKLLYQEWKNSEIENSNYEILGKELIKNYNKIGRLTSYKGYLYYVARKKIITAPNSYQYLYSINRFDFGNQEEEKLVKLPSNIIGGLKFKDEHIYFCLAETKKGYKNVSSNSFGVTGVLYKYNIKSKEQTRLFKKEIEAFAVLDKDILYIVEKNNEYGSEIWKYNKKKHIKIGESDKLISKMEILNGKIYSVYKNRTSSWNIGELDLEKNEITPIINENWHERDIYLDENDILYTSNRKNMLGIYRYNLNSKKSYKINTGSFGMNPVMLVNNLYYIGLNSKGFNIYYLENINEKVIGLEEEAPKKLEEININYKKGDLIRKNYSNIFKFRNRYLPFGLGGSDALDSTRINFDFGYFDSLNFYLESNVFSPNIVSSKIGYNFNTDLYNYNVNFYNPIYKSDLNLIKSITLRLGYSSFNKYNGGINLSLGSVRHKFNSSIDIDYNSGIGVLSRNRYSYLLNKGNISIEEKSSRGYYLYDGIRGKGKLEINSDDVVSLFRSELTYKMFSIKNGLWNPNVFLGDIYGTIFQDRIIGIDKDESYGVEISSELGFSYRVMIAPKIGLAYTDKEVVPYLGFYGEY